MKSPSRASALSGNRERWKLACAVCLLFAAGWFAHVMLRSDLPKPKVKPFASLGAFAAGETVALIGSQGSIAIVSEIPDPKSPPEDPMVRSIKMVAVQVEGFREAMQQQGRFIYLPELKLVRPSDAIKTVWPSGAFLKLLQSLPDGATLVAFCSLPGQLSPAERSLIQSRAGRLIIIGGVVPEVKPLVDTRVAHLGISARVPVPQPAGNEPETPQAWVRRVYAVVKP